MKDQTIQFKCEIDLKDDLARFVVVVKVNNAR